MYIVVTYVIRRNIAVKSGSDRTKSTFIVKIMNNQNSTWQGSITWVEEQKTQNFRSALEMIKMIDGVLDGIDEIEGGGNEEDE